MGKPEVRSTKLGPCVTRGTRALWQAMAKRGWTQLELAKQLGCRSSMVNQWLHGIRTPARHWSGIIERVAGVKASMWGETLAKGESFQLSRTG